MNSVKIFVSYAKDDHKVVEKIIENAFFKVFHYQHTRYKVIYWNDNGITPSEGWKNRIMNEIRDADVFVCMLSPGFLQSQFIINQELPLALERQKDSGITIFSIFIEECDFSDLEIRRFEMVPKKSGRLKPVSKWTPKKECYEFIRSGLKAAIASSLDNLPGPLKKTPQALHPKDKKLFQKQFLNPTERKNERTLIRLNKIIDNDTKKKVKIGISKKDKSFLIFFIGVLMLLILTFKLFIK